MQNATGKAREYIEKQIEFAKEQSEQIRKDIEGIINSDPDLKEKSKLLTIVFLKANDKGIIYFFKVGKAMVYSVDLREKAVSLVEKGKLKVEVAEVFEIDTI